MLSIHKKISVCSTGLGTQEVYKLGIDSEPLIKFHSAGSHLFQSQGAKDDANACILKRE